MKFKIKVYFSFSHSNNQDTKVNIKEIACKPD